jgi:hypothetical protein
MGSNYTRASLIPPFLLMVHATMLNAKRAKDGEPAKRDERPT